MRINGAIDDHYHYEPDMFPLNKMINTMDLNGIKKVALAARMNEPFYMDNAFKRSSTAILRLSLLYLKSIGFMLYKGTIDSKGDFVLNPITRETYKIYSRPDNEAVTRVIDRYPDRFYGWIFVNPVGPSDPFDEIKKYASNPNMIGVKTHPWWHQYPVRKLEKVAEWCEKNNYPIQIHLGIGEMGDYKYLPEKFPNLKIIYLHAGVPFFKELWNYFKVNKDKYPNIYLDLSSPYVDEFIIKDAINAFGAKNCLYGTDGPYGYQQKGADYDYGLIKGWIEELPILQEDKERILYKNFEGLIAR